MIVFVFFFVMAFAGKAKAEDGKLPLDKNEEAFLVAPCPPGQEDIWCVAIKNKTLSEPEWEYRLSTHRADDTEPFGFVRVLKARIETITVIAPRHVRVSPGEIMKAYNGKPIKHVTVGLNRFQGYTETKTLTAARTGSKIVFSVSSEQTHHELSYIYITSLLIILCGAFAIALFIRDGAFVIMLMTIAMLVFSSLVVLLSSSWIQACVPMAVYILGIILGKIVRRWHRTTHKPASNPS